jgi:hypothetical protein
MIRCNRKGRTRHGETVTIAVTEDGCSKPIMLHQA